MTENELDLEVRKLFGPLMSLLLRLMKGESKHIPSLKVLKQISGIAEIRFNIQSYPPHKTGVYLSRTLEMLKQTQALGDSIYKNLEDRFDEDVIDEETGEPLGYDNIIESKNHAKSFFKYLEHELLLLQEDVNREIEVSKSVPSTSKPRKANRGLSFKYNHANDRPADITNLLEDLKKNCLVDSDVFAADFKKVFLGADINRPIKWTGSQSDLFYFIKQIHNINKAVETRTNDIWKIVNNCFVDITGNAFNSVNWRSQKPPSNLARREIIQKIASRLIH